MRQHSAFSLVELSIVLVILGLLVGGVLAGQSLIRAAELRSVSTDFTRYSTAIYAFRDKYFALPGDMTNATSFWPTTANGNGNGAINISLEMFRAWQQLNLAGLVEGSYTGTNGGGTGCGSTCDAVIGTNTPASKITNAGFSFYRIGDDTVADATNFFDTKLNPSNTIVLGADLTNFWTNGPTVLKPEEAWNIDSKMDDGQPQNGKLHTYKNSSCTTTTSSATAAYALSTSSQNCLLDLLIL